MDLRSSKYTCAFVGVMFLTLSSAAAGAELWVPPGGNLQAALDAARPGDTVLLAPGATYVGNFRLPVHGGTAYVTLRTGGNDAVLPKAGERITPAHAPYLAKLRSPNTMPALRTEAAAGYWRVMLLEFMANQNGGGDVVKLGEGSSAQSDLSLVPAFLVIDRVYIHGDVQHGQKRGIFLNSGDTTIVGSWIDQIKAVGQDSQAIAGGNGPGPYRIENNRLEAAGEVFIMGGDDPKIAGLVPADMVFRGNTLTRPLSWRDPIVPAPGGVTATAGTGGLLAAGTYGYRVVARRPAGAVTASSAASVEVTATIAGGGAVTIAWSAVPNAAEYRVYGRTPGGLSMYWTVRGATSFTDTGSAGVSGSAPSAGTVWQVKNLFELKNFRRAVIDYNVMENNWLQAQAGIAVLFSVRNQYGGCTQCVVEDITFEYNIVRNIGGAFSILGQDYNHPSQQTNNIRIRHNLFTGLDQYWGGNGYFMRISEGPRDLVVDHNTIISRNGMGLVSVTGRALSGFVFTNNVARHNSYGIAGAGSGYGNTAIAQYLPNSVIRRNVFAGGKASMYPADNLFPSVASFEGHFTSYAAGDFTLIPGTDWAGAGTDGFDLGADMTRVLSVPDPSVVEPPSVVTETLPPAVELEAYSATLEAEGGRLPYRWGIVSGALPAGVALDPLSGVLSGAAAQAGDFVFAVVVTDAAGATAVRPMTLTVQPAVPPVQIATQVLDSGVATVSYAYQLHAAGGSGAYRWTLTGGALPEGLSLTLEGVVSGTPIAPGDWTFTVTVIDVLDPGRQATGALMLTVAPPPNRAPAIVLAASRSERVPLGASVTLAAAVSDSDGTVARVTFFLDGTPVHSTDAAPFEFTWVAADGGPFTFTATAVDDDGATTASAGVVVTTTAEIVLYAGDVRTMSGDYQLVNDATAAGGQRLWNPNRNAAKVSAALPLPASYVEFTFHAEAGRRYHLWIRGSGEKNGWANDSAFLQFSGSVTQSGAATARIGTTGSMWYSVEECSGAGLLRWGWQDNGFGLNVMGADLAFATTGPQTLRIQPREDGLSIDQIVISPARYLSSAPGLGKDDGTIVAR